MKNFMTVLFFFAVSVAFSQVKEIKGQVLDAEFNNEPLAFAEVRVKGLDLATITDENGRYELELAPGSYSLEVGFIGYETRLVAAEITAYGETTLDPVVLEGKRYERESAQVISDVSMNSR